MKDWWMNLALREKQALSLGAAALILVLLYLLIWSPLTNKVNNLRSQIGRNQQLLSWMKEADKRIQLTENSLQKKGTTPNGVSILTVVQKQINKTPFVSSLGQLRQADSDSVQLSFNNVEFDKLIVWLTQLWQQQGLTITQISATASTTPGLVNTDIVLKSS